MSAATTGVPSVSRSVRDVDRQRLAAAIEQARDAVVERLENRPLDVRALGAMELKISDGLQRCARRRRGAVEQRLAEKRVGCRHEWNAVIETDVARG